MSMIEHFDLSTMETTVKSIDLAKYKYHKHFGNQYPIPSPDPYTCMLGELREYVKQIIRAIGISAEPIVLDVNSVHAAQESYRNLYDRVFAFMDVKELPPMPTTNTFDCYETSKKLWSLVGGYGFNVEIVCDERNVKSNTAAGGIDFSNLKGEMFIEIGYSKKKLAEEPSKLFITDVSYVYVLCKDLLHVYSQLCGTYLGELVEEIPYGEPAGSPAVIEAMGKAITKFETIATKLLSELNSVKPVGSNRSQFK